MLSIIGSIIGLVGSTGPELLKRYMDLKQDKADKAHELAIMAQQAEDQRDMQLIESVGNANVQIQKSDQMITYFFFLEFVLLTFLLAMGSITIEFYTTIWSAETETAFSTILAFWFGQRLVSKWSK
jgi:hypothetical protein